MKTLLLALALSLTAPIVYSQGTLNFNTAQSANSIIKYALPNFGGAPVDGSQHPNARAAIYAGAAGSTEAQLVFVSPAAGFGSGALAGYVTYGSVTIPFLNQGANAVVQIRAWDGPTLAPTYEAALAIPGACVGKSQLYSISALGGPGDPNMGIPPATPAAIPNQVGFALGFTCVPEPSTIVLVFLGLGGLLIRRYKK